MKASFRAMFASRCFSIKGTLLLDKLLLLEAPLNMLDALELLLLLDAPLTPPLPLPLLLDAPLTTRLSLSDHPGE